MNILRYGMLVASCALAIAAAAQQKTKSAGALPKPVAQLRAATYQYNLTFTSGGQNMTMDMNREVKSENGKWFVKDALKSPMGDMAEQVTLEAGTLKCLRRKINQGAATIDLNYTDSVVTAIIDKGDGEKKMLEVALTNPIIIDGAGTDLVIGCLPLKENFTARLELLDAMTLQPKTMELSVAGIEKVTVPAGTFDTYKVLFNAAGSAEKTTFWISTRDRSMIRTEALVPQMGNAVMVAERK